MNRIRIHTQLLCVVVGGSLLLASCVPAADPIMRVIPAVAAVEEDLALAEELELSLMNSSGLPNGQTAPLLYQEAEPPSKQPGLSGVQLMSKQERSELEIPAIFAITRPTETLTTSYESYFITGTSNPDKPVYFGDEAIKRQGDSGVFGVHVALDKGENRFTFRQGDKSQTVNIVRTGAGGIRKIKEIPQSSMVPAYHAGVKVGEKLSVGCIAPAGAEVTATYGERSIKLKQTKEDVKTGYPATFTGKLAIDPDGQDPDTTKKGDRVRYSMTYGAQTREYSSDGLVYVAGKNSRIAIQVVGYVGFIYPEVSNLSSFKEVVKSGARDYITSQTNEYFELSSGGFIHKGQTTILTGKVRVKNKLSEAGFARNSGGETITLVGTRSPVYNAWIADDTFHLRLYNTTGAPKPDMGGSRLAKSVSVSENAEEHRVTYRFPLSGLVWGYDIDFDEGNTILKWKYKPTLGEQPKPLEGMTIVIDPGHGGTDPGALGLAGTIGPSEAVVNLHNATVTRSKLQSLGAEVVLTRTDDDYLSLDDRIKMIAESGADLFLSIHHNSIVESVDANQISGIEIYYHTPLSKKACNNMMNKLSEELGRKERAVTQSYYRVTLLPYAPSMLLELGFMSHPVDYENAANPAEMERVAEAVASGILAALQ